VGTQLLAASAALIITAAARPELVAVHSCTAKLALIAIQVAWILPDSALVGLAQLRGHGDTGRVREVVMRIMSLHLLISVTAAFGLLMVNPVFVRLWVGEAFFAGFGFNSAAAALIVVSSLAHGTITCAAVLGNRGRVGLTVLFQAVVHLGLSYALVTHFGIIGVVWSALASGMTIPLLQGVLLLRQQVQLDVRRLATQWLLPPAARVAPLLAVGWLVGVLSTKAGMVWVIGIQVLATAAFIGVMWPVLGWVWQDPRVRALMIRFRLTKVEA
jgi:O-antigen/teichoic acid export membrane protein